MTNCKSSVQDLPSLIRLLEGEGELIRISEEVSPASEMTEFYLREVGRTDGGRALLFEKVQGSDIPLVMNVFGSFRRLSLCFSQYGSNDWLDQYAQEISGYFQPKLSRGFLSAWQLGKKYKKILDWLPKTHKGAAPCQEVILTGSELDLYRLPLQTCWPLDTAPAITFPLVFTRSLDGQNNNVGVYRLEVLDRLSAGIQWSLHSDAAYFFQQYRKSASPMPVAVVIGTDPATSYAATAPLPLGINELWLAGFLRRQGVEMVRCKTIDLEVPANSEIVLEGFISADEYRLTGSFGSRTGYYSRPESYPVFKLTAITMKKSPIYQSVMVGKAPSEHLYLNSMTEKLSLPFLQRLAPEIIAHRFPQTAGFHNCYLMSFEKFYPYQARKLMSQIWGWSPLSLCNCVITSGSDAPIHDNEAFLNYFLDHVDLQNSFFFSEGVQDCLVHSSDTPYFGAKIGIDISPRIDGEKRSDDSLKKAPIQIKLDWLDKELAAFESRVMGVQVYGLDRRHSAMIIRLNKNKWKSNAQNLAKRIFEKLNFKIFSFFVLIDEKTTDIKNYSLLMHRIFNNVDPKRDLYFDHDGRVFVDASYKSTADGFTREWPLDAEIT